MRPRVKTVCDRLLYSCYHSYNRYAVRLNTPKNGERRAKDAKDGKKYAKDHKRRQRRVLDTCSQTETNSDGNVEQRCADCVSKTEHCQKVEPKKARTRSASKAAVTTPFFHNRPFSGLPLFQEQDITYFYYACNYYSAPL